MKKRNKKNNPNKRKNVFARTKLSGYGFAAVNDKKHEAFNTLSMNPVFNVEQSIFNMASKAQIKWNMFMVVNCTESNGKTKLISDQIMMKDERFISDIDDFLDNEYSDLIDRCAKVMTVNYAGWMATPNRRFEPSSEQIESLMNQLSDNL